MGIGNDCLSRTHLARQLRGRIDKWDYMKLKVFCTTKEMVFKLKRLPTEWQKSLPGINQTRNYILGAPKTKLTKKSMTQINEMAK
jgi:hypothetical protein